MCKDSSHAQESSKVKKTFAQLMSIAKSFVSKASERDSQISPNLPPSDDESIGNPTLDDAKPSTSLQSRDQCSPSAGRTMSSSPSTHSSRESPDTSKKSIHVQQSLLILINLHLLRRLLQTSTEENHSEPCLTVVCLKRDLPTFFKKVGYVSNHFFESALLSIKVFFQTNTFAVVPKELPQLFLLTSFFGTSLPSVFLHILNESFNVEKFLKYSHIISGLELVIYDHNYLEFLNKSSFYFPHLTRLHVCVSRTIAMELIELLKVDTTITSVDLGGSDVGDDGARALAEALKVNTTVTNVDLFVCYIGADGARALADALKVNTTVTSLCLGENDIVDEGAVALAESLKVNTTVISIDLNQNCIEDEGARALAELLTVNTTLTSVNLFGNSIGDEGLLALAEALKVNTSVTNIDLGGHDIGNEGTTVLAEALKFNNTLISIGLRQNFIGADGVLALVDSLKINSTVTSIDLSDNYIEDERVVPLIEDLLSERKCYSSAH
ncbi:hypothetical protein GEMRC1_009797 [Eukaryota sp. GEM-RC1]